MRIAPFANDDDKLAFQEAKELELAASLGGRWRVDIVPGRFGWYARGIKLCHNPHCNRPCAKGSEYCFKCRPEPPADGPSPGAADGSHY
jgi:hypothetical protein